MRKPSLSKPVYWRGRQWAVTRYGVECLTQFYAIRKDALFRSGDPLSEEPSGWIAHMAQKRWVDILDFQDALAHAVRLWPGGGPIKGRDR